MAMKSNKMQWFIDMYNNGTLKNMDYLIPANVCFGTVCMPTGTGKSARVFENVLHAINNRGSKKVMINISCPILKLTQQMINDLFAILSEIYKDSHLKFEFYVNSSDSGQKYNTYMQDFNIDINSFSRINDFFNNSSDVAIIASCHKSLSKYVNVIKNKNTDKIDIISYLDEAHLIDCDDKNVKPEDDDITQIDLNALCANSDNVYAFSATPRESGVRLINSYNLCNPDNLLVNLTPTNAIAANMIVSPYMKYIKVSNEHISINILKAIMKDAKRQQPTMPYHKILVTLTSANEVKSMRLALEKAGYKVFSTCSRFGFGTDENANIEAEYKDVTEFIDAVDNYDGDCFVLHIRQLIQGIDIKSLTDCVIYSESNGSTEHYIHDIQTIGRVLRCLPGERGLNIEDRKKKFGMVYYLTPIGTTKPEEDIQNFLVRYYGINNIKFDTVTRSITPNTTDNDIFDTFGTVKPINGTDIIQVNELLINAEKFIKEKVLPTKAFYDMTGMKLNVKLECEEFLAKYDTFGTTVNSVQFLNNTEMLNEVSKLFKKYSLF